MSAAPASTSSGSSSSATEHARDSGSEPIDSGLFAETVAALLLRLKGYAIVARRYKTPVGEIDLVALKGKRLAFIEVKRRKTRRTPPGRCRPSSGGASSGPRNIGWPDIRTYAGHDIAFDVVLAAPWAWPRYIENAFSVA